MKHHLDESIVDVCHKRPIRLIIFGPPGSGKSTFAYKLSKILKVPLVHLDSLYFGPKWGQVDRKLFREALLVEAAKDQWIIEGNGLSTLDLRWQRATAVIYFKIPRWLCVLGVFIRIFWKKYPVQDKPHGCAERVTWSLLVYLWRFDKNVQSSITKLTKSFSATPYFVVSSRKELFNILNNL